jgi:hypothetical protein
VRWVPRAQLAKRVKLDKPAHRAPSAPKGLKVPPVKRALRVKQDILDIKAKRVKLAQRVKRAKPAQPAKLGLKAKLA